ncbi:hypothetical protein A9Q82_07765, partial [Cycloclasticus sp. 46_120_T64]
RAEAERAEAERAEAERAEAERAEAERAEAERAEAERAEAARTEAARTEAARTEAARTEAAPTEAAPTEAAPTEAARVDGSVEALGVNIPSWAGEQFNALIGVVNKISLAIPSTAVSGELEFCNELKKVSGQPEWVLGLKMTGKDFVAVVDLGHLLLNQGPRDIAARPYKKIILLANSRWGIALDSVSAETEILSATIKWRDSTRIQQWLRGFESSRQLAIVDPAKMFVKDK